MVGGEEEIQGLQKLGRGQSSLDPFIFLLLGREQHDMGRRAGHVSVPLGQGVAAAVVFLPGLGVCC